MGIIIENYMHIENEQKVSIDELAKYNNNWLRSYLAFVYNYRLSNQNSINFVSLILNHIFPMTKFVTDRKEI